MNKGKRFMGSDKHLGDYVQRETGADMLLWDGACIVHEEFKAKALLDLKPFTPMLLCWFTQSRLRP